MIEPGAPLEVVEPQPDNASVSSDEAVESTNANPPQVGNVDILLSPEPEMALETTERLIATQGALAKLVEAGGAHARNFERDIRRLEYDFDPIAMDFDNKNAGAIVERNVKVATGAPGLQTIDLWTFPGTDEKSAYKLSLSYLPTEKSVGAGPSPIMLSGEWPINFAPQLTNNPFDLYARGRRIQDFMFSPGATTIPVREADFTYLAWYRPVGSERSYEATHEQMDVILDILVEAYVMNGNKKGPKAAELVPELVNLR